MAFHDFFPLLGGIIVVDDDDEADLSECHQLGSIFRGRLAPWTTNMCLDRLEFLEKFLSLWLHCSVKQGWVASAAGGTT